MLDRRHVATLAFVVMTGSAAGRADNDVPTCVTHRSQVVNAPPGFDHVVHVSNDCDFGVACVVQTTVNPDRIEVSLDRGQTASLVTYRGAATSHFDYRIACTRSR